VDALLRYFDVESIMFVEWGIPVWQVGIYVILISICMLSHRYRLGIVISYAFVFYWGYILNRGTFAEVGNPAFAAVYAVFGILLVVLSIVAFVRR